ncbi:MAG: TetR/AcrR family transcriptional regulator [Acidimicrobiia bacterium]
MAASRPYHHGALRTALLDAAAAEIADVGPAAMSVRKVAARAGVSHTAAAHHFGDKRGLLTALAVEGHRALADALVAARPHGMLALGAAYLRFAHEHRPWFDVMFRPDLVRTDDPAFAEASRSSFGELREAATAASGGDLVYGAWALVHGIAVLWLAGNLPAATIDEAEALFRRSAKALAGAGRRPRRR